MTQPASSPVETATPADTSTASTDNASPDVNVGQPDIHAPGLPPGGSSQIAPNRVMVRRGQRSENDDGSSAAVAPETAVAPNVVTVSRAGSPAAGPATAPIPTVKASKADWVTYAVDSGATQADAEAMTKDQLIDTYGSH